MIKLEEIQEIRLQWDWQVAVIPKEYIKELQYKETASNGSEIECEQILLAVDLEYVSTHPLENETIMIRERIQAKDTWYIEVITQSEKMIFNIPSYRKEIYCSNKNILVGQDAENLCELHQIEKDSYIMKWRELGKQEISMNQEEWKILFEKDSLTKISNWKHQLGLELIDRILLKNREENLDVIKRIHKIDTRTGEFYSMKKGYVLSKEYYPLHGVDIFIFNAKNHSHHWNFNFILVPNLAQKEQSLYKIIEEGIPNEDTKNYFSRTMIVHNANEKLQEDMLEYLNENLIFVTYQELNQIWYDVHKEWNLL